MIIPISILISAGHRADLWAVRGIAIGCMWLAFLFRNVNSKHDISHLLRSFTPRIHPAVGCIYHECWYDLYLLFEEILILDQVLTLFKTAVLLLIVVTGKAPHLSASQGERLISSLA